VSGRLSGAIPGAGELLPETIEASLRQFFHLPTPPPRPQGEGRERRPTLCAGCPHRAAFFAIKRAMPKAIFPSDIGCYTLGLNLEAVDTVLCMAQVSAKVPASIIATGKRAKKFLQSP